MLLNGGLIPEHSLASRLRAGFVHQLDVAAVVVIHHVMLEVPVLLGADVTHLLGLVLVHRRDMIFETTVRVENLTTLRAGKVFP